MEAQLQTPPSKDSWLGRLGSSEGWRPLPTRLGTTQQAASSSPCLARPHTQGSLCCDMPFCTLSEPCLLTSFPQATPSPHATTHKADMCAGTCGHWVHSSSPSGGQIPSNPRTLKLQGPAPRSLYIVGSQGLHGAHICPLSKGHAWPENSQWIASSPRPSAQHLLTGNSLPPETTVRTVSHG